MLVSVLGLALAVVGGAALARGVADAPADGAAVDGAAVAGVAAAGGAEHTPRSAYVVAPSVRLGPAADPPAGVPVPHTARGRPLRVVVPELGVDAPVVGIDAQGGVLRPPDDPQVLGWWQSGAVPGARTGSALVTGHTVSSGGGAFNDLETLQRGDEVRVRTGSGVIRYAVTAVTTYRKASLARDVARVFSQSVPGRLVLITCEDWNGSAYLSNAVVLAEPTG